MGCGEYQELISDYIDGTLELGEEARIERHLADCEPCRTVRDDLLQIVHFSRQLPLHTPSGAVWAELQTKIAAEPAAHLWSRMSGWAARAKSFKFDFNVFQLAAGAAAFLIVFSLVVIISRQPPSAPSQPSASGQGRTAELNLLSNVEYQEIEAKIAGLRESVEQRRVAWSPELQLAYERNMRHVDQCLQSCRQQVNANPSDRVSQELMRDAYLEKQRLLDEFTKF